MQIEESLDRMRQAYYAANGDSGTAEFDVLLAQLLRASQSIDMATKYAVRFARHERWTWVDLAAAVSISESTARQRWAKLDPIVPTVKATYSDKV
jgi:hypothetical protein